MSWQQCYLWERETAQDEIQNKSTTQMLIDLQHLHPYWNELFASQRDHYDKSQPLN